MHTLIQSMEYEENKNRRICMGQGIPERDAFMVHMFSVLVSFATFTLV